MERGEGDGQGRRNNLGHLCTASSHPCFLNQIWALKASSQEGQRETHLVLAMASFFLHESERNELADAPPTLLPHTYGE